VCGVRAGEKSDISLDCRSSLKLRGMIGLLAIGSEQKNPLSCGIRLRYTARPMKRMRPRLVRDNMQASSHLCCRDIIGQCKSTSTIILGIQDDSIPALEGREGDQFIKIDQPQLLKWLPFAVIRNDISHFLSHTNSTIHHALKYQLPLPVSCQSLLLSSSLSTPTLLNLKA
jgi:hypothetical protein